MSPYILYKRWLIFKIAKQICVLISQIHLRNWIMNFKDTWPELSVPIVPSKVLVPLFRRSSRGLGIEVGSDRNFQIRVCCLYGPLRASQINPMSSNSHPSPTVNKAIHCLKWGGYKTNGKSYNFGKIWIGVIVIWKLIDDHFCCYFWKYTVSHRVQNHQTHVYVNMEEICFFSANMDMFYSAVAFAY